MYFRWHLCTMKLIADYDQILDEQATALQKKIETYLSSLERDSATNKVKADAKANEFYDSVRVDLSAMRVRAAAIGENAITVKQIDTISDNIKLLEQAHTEGIGAKEIPVM